MEVGVAYGNITPPIGTALRGYYIERIADAVHDPLQVKALVIYDGSRFFVWVTVDLIDVPPRAYQRAREHIAKRWDIPMAFITIGSTHTHTGPFLTEDYEQILFDTIVETVDRAWRVRTPVVMKTGVSAMQGISFNRRYFMADGHVEFNPGVLNPAIVKPAGPIDPQLGVIAFEKSAGRPYVLIVNFAIHLDTIGGTAISADFPHFLERALRAHFGEDVAVIFAIGACGNINHIDVTKADDLKSFVKSEQIGHVLAQRVIDSYASLAKAKRKQICAHSRSLTLQSPVFSPDVVERASSTALQTSSEESSTPAIREARKILRVAQLNGKGLKAEVQVVTLGSTALVMLPTEVFVELGLAIKTRSPFSQTLVVTFTNHSVGYIPDRAAFSQGGYEVEVSMIAVGQGERLVKEALEVLNRLYEATSRC